MSGTKYQAHLRGGELQLRDFGFKNINRCYFVK
jgi:hypothetical protein